MSLNFKQLTRFSGVISLVLLPTLALTGCPGNNKPAAPPAQGPMPVQVSSVDLKPVPNGDTYVATIKSRRSATIQPQVDGNLTRILVHSGQAVRAGELLMGIDPLKQQASVAQQEGTELQKKAVVDYNKVEENRQRQLFEAGVISRDAYEQALQAFGNSTGDYNAAKQGTRVQQQQLAYYQIRAPFAGIVGDIPVHQGDYVSPTTLLTTVDENKELEAYIYLPTERAANVRTGLAVELVGTNGDVLARSTINFVSPQVDNGLQSILAKAPIPSSPQLRNGQVVNARVIFSTNQVPTVPVLAVTRIGGQTFVYVAKQTDKGFVAHQVAVNLGEVVGNNYPVSSGLKPGDSVILSGIQFLYEGAAVQPIVPQAGPPPTNGG